MTEGNEPIYIGEFCGYWDGEEEIYNRFPYKRQGILTQLASSKTLKVAKQKAKSFNRAFIIYVIDTRKYLIYI